jgi:hypothetical protein
MFKKKHIYILILFDFFQEIKKIQNLFNNSIYLYDIV